MPWVLGTHTGKGAALCAGAASTFPQLKTVKQADFHSLNWSHILDTVLLYPATFFGLFP